MGTETNARSVTTPEHEGMTHQECAEHLLDIFGGRTIQELQSAPMRKDGRLRSDSSLVTILTTYARPYPRQLDRHPEPTQAIADIEAFTGPLSQDQKDAIDIALFSERFSGDIADITRHLLDEYPEPSRNRTGKGTTERDPARG